MPTYTLQAPNGKTYTIEGPPGASQSDVQAEVLRRDPSAATPAKAVPVAPAAKPQATLGGTLARAAYNLPMDTAETLKGVMQQFGPEGVIAQSVMHPVQAVQKVNDFADQASKVVGGGLQHLNDITSALNGTPTPIASNVNNRPAADQFVQNHLTKQAIYKAVGDHPAAAALLAAPLVGRALDAAGVTSKVSDAAGAVGDAVGDATGRVTGAVQNVAQAGRRAQVSADIMGDYAKTRTAAEQAANQAAAQAAAEKAARVQAIAEKARARSATLNARSSAAAAAATPPKLAIGTPADLSTIGEGIRQPAMANEAALNAQMRDAFAQHQAAAEAVAAEQGAKGIGVSDTNAAKDLIAKSEALVEPDAITRPDVGMAPADSAGAKLHKVVLDTLRPKVQTLTKEEAVRASQAGVKVLQNPDGGYYRLVKPSLQNVDELRRFIGNVMNGTEEGYGSINRAQAGTLYRGVSDAIDEYVNGASQKAREAWATGKASLAPFENVRAGQAIVGTQPGSAAAAVPASQIPGRILAGGRDTIQQARAVAGDQPVENMLRSMTQHKLAGANNSAAAARVVAPGTPLGTAISTNSDLASAVQDYINGLRTAEGNAAQATDLSARSATNADRAQRFDKIAQTLQGDAGKASAMARQNAADLAQLEIADPRQVGSQYVKLLQRSHAAGTITTEQLKSGMQLAQSAENDFALKSSRTAWLKKAALALGVGSLPMGAAHLMRGN